MQNDYRLHQQNALSYQKSLIFRFQIELKNYQHKKKRRNEQPKKKTE